jgi:ribosomal protein L32E
MVCPVADGMEKLRASRHRANGRFRHSFGEKCGMTPPEHPAAAQWRRIRGRHIATATREKAKGEALRKGFPRGTAVRRVVPTRHLSSG